MIIQRDSEQPNENQSSFGPSNQSSSYEQPNYQTTQSQNPSGGWGSSGNTGFTGGQISALPWQNNDMQPVSAPSWQTSQVGHEGSTQGGMNRDAYRDAWMSSGVSNNQGMDQWLQQHGGQRLNDAGVVRTPFGEILDMGMAFKTGSGKPAWTDIGMNNAGQQSPFGPSQGYGNGMVGGGITGGLFGQVGPNPGMPNQNSQIWQFLQQMLGGQQDPNNPIYRHTTQVPQRPDLFANASSNQMDISSLLGPSAGMMDNQAGSGIGQMIKGKGMY